MLKPRLKPHAAWISVEGSALTPLGAALNKAFWAHTDVKLAPMVAQELVFGACYISIHQTG